MAPLSTKHHPKTPQGIHRLNCIRRKAYREGLINPWKDKRCEYNISFPCTPDSCPQIKELRTAMQHFKGCYKRKRIERSKLKAELRASLRTTAKSPLSPSDKGETYDQQ